MASPHMLKAPRRPKRRGKLRPTPYRIGEFIRAYLIALGVVVAAAIVQPITILPAWLIVGGFLTRYISDRVIWWKFTFNLEQVYRAKVGMLLTWPLAVPVLIFKLWVTRIL